MGFFETIHDCGDGNYCVSIVSSLDDFKSISWVHCQKHKNNPKYYNIYNFLKRYSTNPFNFNTRINILDSKKNSRDKTLTKFELIDVSKEKLNEFKLLESKKIYFSEYDDLPSWNIIDGKVIFIDYIDDYKSQIPVDSPICKDRNVVFNWQKNMVEILTEEQMLK